VYVNGRRLEEPSTVAVPAYDWPLDELGFPTEEPYRVPDGCYFVLGDNRNDSNDSHRWRDPVTGEPRPELAASRVLGKAMAIFWPPPRIGLTQDNHDVRLAPEAVQASAGGTAEAAGLP
jgi:signal peptidase I